MCEARRQAKMLQAWRKHNHNAIAAGAAETPGCDVLAISKVNADEKSLVSREKAAVSTKMRTLKVMPTNNIDNKRRLPRSESAL